MCLIAVKNKNVPMNKNFYKSLARSFYLRNNEGCGFAIYKADSKTIFYRKGIYHLNKLISEIKSYKPQLNDVLVVHLRKTSGSPLSIVNTHPFRINKDRAILNSFEGSSQKDYFLFHNGNFTNFNKVNSIYSDTYLFSYLFMHNKTVVNNIVESIRRDEKMEYFLLGNNKIVVLKNNGNLFIGNKRSFVEDEHGFIYSNDSYKKVEKKKRIDHWHCIDDEVHCGIEPDLLSTNIANRFLQNRKIQVDLPVKKEAPIIHMKSIPEIIHELNFVIPKVRVIFNPSLKPYFDILDNFIRLYKIKSIDGLIDYIEESYLNDRTAKSLYQAFFTLFGVISEKDRNYFMSKNKILTYNIIFLYIKGFHTGVISYFLTNSRHYVLLGSFRIIENSFPYQIMLHYKKYKEVEKETVE